MDYEKDLELLRFKLDNVESNDDFKNYLQDIFSKLGYAVTQKKDSDDVGADLILEKNGLKYIVQAKYGSEDVGNEAIQSIHTAKDTHKADIAAVVTNNKFTKQAMEDAFLGSISLVDADKLQSLLYALSQGRFIDIFR